MRPCAVGLRAPAGMARVADDGGRRLVMLFLYGLVSTVAPLTSHASRRPLYRDPFRVVADRDVCHFRTLPSEPAHPSSAAEDRGGGLVVTLCFENGAKAGRLLQKSAHADVSTQGDLRAIVPLYVVFAQLDLSISASEMPLQTTVLRRTSGARRARECSSMVKRRWRSM